MLRVLSWQIAITTAPIAPSASTFGFEVQLKLEDQTQGPLRVETLDELMAICALLQIPTGQLFFDAVGQKLLKMA